MRERIAMVPGLFLESIEQAGDSLVLKGNSPDEAQVTQFGRSLEFSNGLFSNLNIETTRTEIQDQNAVVKLNEKAESAPKMEIVNFTIKCGYTASKAVNGDANPTTASAQGPAANPAAPVQVAKN
jgi:hypothetical protein